MAFLDRQRLRAMVRKEFLQQLRDPQTLRTMLVAPVIQLIVLGFALTNDLKNVSVAVLDLDRTPQSRRALEMVKNTGYFRMRPVGSHADLVQALDSGRAQAAIEIAPGFARSLARGEEAPVQVLADGSDTNSATLAFAAISGALRRYGAEAQAEWTARHARVNPVPVELRSQTWYNPALISRHYVMPGVVAIIIAVLASALTVLSIARERELGTLEQLLVSPISRWEFMLGKMTPPAVLAFGNATIVFALSVLVFRVPFRGSPFTVLASAVPFIIATLGVGLLISSVAKTQQQAQLLNFFANLPQTLLSGFIFPIATMPAWAQALSAVIPMRYFLVLVRGAYIKGLGVPQMWPAYGTLCLLSAVIFLAGVLSFRRRLD